MYTFIISLHSCHPNKSKNLNCTIFRGNPFTLTALVSLALVQRPSVSWRVRANAGGTQALLPYVCFVWLCWQCREGSCFWFRLYRNPGGSTTFLGSLGPGSIFSHCEYVHSVNDALGLSVIA